jgi:hypothetical protein
MRISSKLRWNGIYKETKNKHFYNGDSSGRYRNFENNAKMVQKSAGMIVFGGTILALVQN